LLGVFTTSITGNLVVATASVASMKGVLCRSFVCIAFFLAGAVAAALSLRLRLAHGLPVRVVCSLLFGIEIGLLIASWVIGIQYDSTMLANQDIDKWVNVLVGTLMGASMGFHNVAAKEAIANCPPTTVMTSTMINVAQNLSNTVEYGLAKHSLLRLQTATGPLTEEQRKGIVAKFDDSLGKFVTTFKPLAFFIVGCVIGAITMDRGSWHCLIIPIFIVLIIIIDTLAKELSILAAKREAQRIEQAAAAELVPVEKEYSLVPAGEGAESYGATEEVAAAPKV
jgi:uncharacterized membrane protein YoaK (UPF0700 family)